MAATRPTRIDGELFEAARDAGLVHSRSAAQQLAHWARLGRQLEAASATNGLADALLGPPHAYDRLHDAGQAEMRATWSSEVDGRIASLELGEEFRASGQSWSELDAAGDVVVRQPRDAAA